MHSNWWTKVIPKRQEQTTCTQPKNQPAAPAIGLALSGGGERGVAHIGVIAVLEEHGILPRFIAGTSAGALVGALYCAGWDSQRMIQAARAIDWGQIRQVSWSDNRGVLRSEPIARWLSRYIGNDLQFDELDFPLAVVATDLLSGDEVVLTEGSVTAAVQASAAVPGIFTPYQTDDGRLLVDGGVVNNLPVDIVRHLGADYIIGVDVSHHNSTWPQEEPRNVIDVMSLVYQILRRNTDQLHGHPDCLVTPVLPKASLLKVARYADQFYEAGRHAMQEKLSQVQSDLNRAAL